MGEHERWGEEVDVDPPAPLATLGGEWASGRWGHVEG
jgi:hypothetical protein